jgi:hypothetical protein
VKKVTITELKSCAQDLKQVRAQLPDNLEPRVTALFGSVIKRLEQCETVVNERAALIALIDDGIRLAGHLGEAVFVIANLVHHFRE